MVKRFSLWVPYHGDLTQPDDTVSAILCPDHENEPAWSQDILDLISMPVPMGFRLWLYRMCAARDTCTTNDFHDNILQYVNASDIAELGAPMSQVNTAIQRFLSELNPNHPVIIVIQ